MAKKVAVPSLVGTTQDSAEATLNDSGLSVVKRYVSGEPDGTVYSQTPPYPAKVAKGDVLTIDVLRAPEAPIPVDLGAVTKSLGELNKAVAELKASVAELSASVAEHRTSVATKDAIAALGKDVQDLRDGVGKAMTAAVQAAATRVQAQPRESSAGDRSPAPQSPPPSTDKPAGNGNCSG